MKTITTAAANARNAAHQDRPPWRSRRRLATPPASLADRSLRGTETVLVVDDTPMMGGLLAGVLRQFGYTVLKTSDAIEAQRLAEAGKRIDLLLLDLSSPESSDLQLALWFRATHSETMVLVVSASFWELNYQIGESQHIFFLAKPFTPRELGGMVRRILDPAGTRR